jgi:GNAT superfamily N-acetyltransferase
MPAKSPGRLIGVLREVAEYPNSFVPLGPRDERIETPRFTLCMGAGSRWNSVQRQRFEAHEVDDVVSEARRLLRERGRSSTQWEIGSAAQPEDLVSRLLERGLVHDKEPFAVALVLQREPPPAPDGIVARRVETFDEFAAANEVQWEAFDTPQDEIEEYRAMLPDRWREPHVIMHAAWLDGEIVSAGTCAPTKHGLVLFGGATRPSVRGRGAYRALIRARYDEAVATGTPALLTQAGAMSRPILERTGFRPVGRIEILLDEFDRPAG